MIYFKDYYKILGVLQFATIEEIKRNFKQLALKWHPDKNPNLDATEKMRELLEAKLILLNPESRAKYDIEYNIFYQTSQISDKNQVKEDKYSDYNTEPTNTKYQNIKFEDIIEKARQDSNNLVEELISELKSGANAASKGFFDSINDFFFKF